MKLVLVLEFTKQTLPVEEMSDKELAHAITEPGSSRGPCIMLSPTLKAWEPGHQWCSSPRKKEERPRVRSASVKVQQQEETDISV